MINAPFSNEDPSLSPWRLQFSVDKVHLNLNIGLKLNFQIISDRIELKFCRNWSIDVSKSEHMDAAFRMRFLLYKTNCPFLIWSQDLSQYGFS